MDVSCHFSIIFLLSILVFSEVFCQETPPTYDLLLTYSAEQPISIVRNRTLFLEAYAKAGLSEQDVEVHGRAATDWFLEKYGVDFTDIDPSYYTDGVVSAYNGSVLFMSFINLWPDGGQYRLVSAINHTHSALFTNAPNEDLGWMLRFRDDFVSTGTLNMTIPARSISFCADYIINVLMDDREQVDPFFPTDALNGDVLWITYKHTEVFFPVPVLPEGRQLLQIIDLETWNDYYGAGKAQGITDFNTGDIRNVLRFPEYA